MGLSHEKPGSRAGTDGGPRSAGRRSGEGRGRFHPGSGGHRAGRAAVRRPEAPWGRRAWRQAGPFVHRGRRRRQFGGRQLVGRGHRIDRSPLGRSSLGRAFRWAPLLRRWRPLVMRRGVVVRRWRRGLRLQLTPAGPTQVAPTQVRAGACLLAGPGPQLRSCVLAFQVPVGSIPGGRRLFDRARAPRPAPAPATAPAPDAVTHFDGWSRSPVAQPLAARPEAVPPAPQVTSRLAPYPPHRRFVERMNSGAPGGMETPSCWVKTL